MQREICRCFVPAPVPSEPPVNCRLIYVNKTSVERDIFSDNARPLEGDGFDGLTASAVELVPVVRRWLGFLLHRRHIKDPEVVVSLLTRPTQEPLQEHVPL